MVSLLMSYQCLGSASVGTARNDVWGSRVDIWSHDRSEFFLRMQIDICSQRDVHSSRNDEDVGSRLQVQKMKIVVDWVELLAENVQKDSLPDCRPALDVKFDVQKDEDRI